MMLVLYIISIIIMLGNVICIYILIRSIKANKQVKSMNEFIEYTTKLRNEHKFIVRDKNCKSLGYLMHTAISNNEPILILDLEDNYEDQ